MFLLLFNRAADKNKTALCTGDCALDEEQIAFCIRTDDFEVLNRDALMTHMAGEVLGFENLTGVGACAH